MTSKPKKPTKKTARTASKTTAAYWSQKIYLEQKDEWQSAHYFARMQARGVRRKVRLESSIREEAAREAATFYRNIAANGWPAEESFSEAVSEATGLPKNPTLEEWLGMATAEV